MELSLRSVDGIFYGPLVPGTERSGEIFLGHATVPQNSGQALEYTVRERGAAA